MKIYQATKPTNLNQGFDWSPSMIDYYTKLGMKNHGGYDWALRTGQPVYWDCDLEGIIINNERDSNGGLGVNILTNDGEKILKHRFWHLEGFCCAKGDKVKMGDTIGWGDNTGLSLGSHLHRDAKELEERVKDGLYTINGKSYSLKYPNNGTFGTIRLDQYMVNQFVLDALPKETFIKKALLMILKLLQKRLNK